MEVKELLICWPDYGYTTNNRGIINKTKKMPSNSPSREDKNQAWYKFSNSPWYCPHHNITLHIAICQHIFRYNLDEYCHKHPSWLSTPNIPGICTCTSIARKYECKGLGYSLSTLSHSGIKDQSKMQVIVIIIIIRIQNCSLPSEIYPGKHAEIYACYFGY